MGELWPKTSTFFIEKFFSPKKKNKLFPISKADAYTYDLK